MWTEKIMIPLLLLSSTAFSDAVRENVPPFTPQEMKNYIARSQGNQLDPEQPILSRTAVTRVLEEIYAGMVQHPIPGNLEEYHTMAQKDRPDQNRLLSFAQQLRLLLNSSEVAEVSGIRMEWFKNVGQAIIALDGVPDELLRAVKYENMERYQQALSKYRAGIDRLDKLMSKPDRLSTREVKAIHSQNTAIRKKYYDYLQKRYEKTVELQKSLEKSMNDSGKNRNK